MRSQDLGFQHIEARIDRGTELGFIDAGVCRHQADEIGHFFARIVVSGGQQVLSSAGRALRGTPCRNETDQKLQRHTISCRNILLHPIRAEIRAGHNLFQVQDHAQVPDRTGGSHGLGKPGLGVNGASSRLPPATAMHAGHQIFAGGEQQIILADRELDFPL